MYQRVRTTDQGFDEIRQTINSASSILGTAGIKVGQVSKSQDRKVFNAAVVIAPDKAGYAKFLGRDMDYLHIPLSGQMVMNEVRNVIVDIIQETFMTNAEPSGKPWLDLEESTERWRKSKGYNIWPPLIASGDLMAAVMRWPKDSLTNYATVGANARLVISIEEIDPSQQQKAYVHNIGGPWGWYGSNIPARPFMPSDTNDFVGADRKRITSAARRGFKKYTSGFDHPERIKKPR